MILNFFWLVILWLNVFEAVLCEHRPRACAPGNQYILSNKFQITSERQVRKFKLVVTNTTAALDGFWRPVLAINGQIPGPLIEANEGDHVEITVVNQLDSHLTIHWHGIHQNGTNWEDGPSGITQCPIPPFGGLYTYKFTLKQYGTYCTSHFSNLKADGVFGPMIIHSPRDPLKRGVDYDRDIVLMVADWYHDISSVIVTQLNSNQGYRNHSTAPSPNSAIINGVGTWDCRFATTTQRCRKTFPPQFSLVAGSKTRFRLINAGSHAMFYVSADNHTLNVTEADATPVYGPTGVHRITFHNGQRYSIIVDTPLAEAGTSFYLRAKMNLNCWAWVASDVQDTGLAIIRVVHSGQQRNRRLRKDLPTTQDWADRSDEQCMDLDSNLLVPIIPVRVPKTVTGSQTMAATFGFRSIATGVRVPVAPAPAAPVSPAALSTPASLERKFHPIINKRQVKIPVFQRPPSLGRNGTAPSIIDQGGPPPTPAGTEPRFYVNNIAGEVFSYQATLNDLAPGGSGVVNTSRMATVFYNTSDWQDLYLVNLDSGLDHPFHLHGMDMHIVAVGNGTPTPENLRNLTYRTENPLRRDTFLVKGGTFLVARILTDLPGVWMMVRFLGQVIVQPDKIRQFQIPERTRALCDAHNGPKGLTQYG
ncbi:hypothetical protein CROQUDRAFT_37096 [Cronartium quercuum f. sp. fusiforme G11]|uniref:Laccase n=1 Tax=Cronartium quercuum f. sp. fusiforme G11 TaxID=708437 RepID=A0A9P6NTC0_9BASI|nr:hypothetical protein CROQUDRAFT_37096 [Cronartium quercuum f. sp. fusiforme G11]